MVRKAVERGFPTVGSRSGVAHTAKRQVRYYAVEETIIDAGTTRSSSGEDLVRLSLRPKGVHA